MTNLESGAPHLEHLSRIQTYQSLNWPGIPSASVFLMSASALGSVKSMAPRSMGSWRAKEKEHQVGEVHDLKLDTDRVYYITISPRID